MDELKLALTSKFMKGIVTKIVRKAIVKKFGYEVDIQINNISVETIDGKVSLHVDVDADVDKEDFVKIIKDVGLM